MPLRYCANPEGLKPVSPKKNTTSITDLGSMLTKFQPLGGSIA